LLVIYGHISGKGDGKIIFKGPFGDAPGIFSCQYRFKILPRLLLFGRVIQPVIEYLEDQLIAFFPVFPHQGFQVFHGWGLKRLKTIQFENGANDIQDIIPFSHGFRSEIPCSLRQRWFGHMQIFEFANVMNCKSLNLQM